ncbi:hypothetical protein F5X97DRAFT_107850 [Nemania serpens]|nr:hypothetical protein F5X97DRAFT_107850 [Nemania serpens]
MASEETNSIHSPESEMDEPTVSTMTPATPPSTTTAILPKEAEEASSSSKKRSATTVEPSGSGKSTKRRAARACVSCRARKVRCDVVEGAPCGNCRWDGVECIVQESRRRKKSLFTNPINPNNCAPHHYHAEAHMLRAKTRPNPIAIASVASAQHARHPAELPQTSSALKIDAHNSGARGVEMNVPQLQ